MGGGGKRVEGSRPNAIRWRLSLPWAFQWVGGCSLFSDVAIRQQTPRPLTLPQWIQRDQWTNPELAGVGCVSVCGEQLGILQRLGIHTDKMKRFILAVRDRMLDNPYHNWTHIFDVTQVRADPVSRLWVSFGPTSSTLPNLYSIAPNRYPGRTPSPRNVTYLLPRPQSPSRYTLALPTRTLAHRGPPGPAPSVRL